MRTHRTQLFAVVALALSAALSAGCGARTAAPPARGILQASIAAPPTDVQAVLVTVSGGDIAGSMRMTLSPNEGGHWSGRLLDVPPGTGLTVTAYAYAGSTVPEDPEADTTGLLYRGARTNVTVTAGLVTDVQVPVLPWPDGGGGFGVNTPPHLTRVGHPTSVASDASATVTATAVDPDAGATLTYTWSDDLGGLFTGGDEFQPNRFSNQEPGATVSATWTPPAGFVGTATIQVTVSDGAASATTTFPIRVGSGIDVGLVFDVLPSIELLGASSQDLAPGGSATIAWRLVYPDGAGPDAPTELKVATAWTDSCLGAFSPAESNQWISPFEPTSVQAVSYTAPADVPELASCTLTLTITDPAGAQAFSQLRVWVSPAATPPVSGMVLFVTSARFPGGFFSGNAWVADAICQEAAAGGLVPAGTYHAIMSFPGLDARDRIVDAAYVRQDGVPVAASKADLLDGSLLAAIDLDESGQPSATEVWTGSLADGTLDTNLTQCSGWSSSLSSDHQGTAGESSATDGRWLRSDLSFLSPYWCSDEKPIYCAQVSSEGPPM